jgi:hypothetical protein
MQMMSQLELDDSFSTQSLLPECSRRPTAMTFGFLFSTQTMRRVCSLRQDLLALQKV